uniref:Transposase n=1 Tax=Mesocestoides corti TaxID=53468 RepID=A0A5K3FRP6_MESCO
MLASDSSVKLINIVHERGFDGIAANLLSLPYRRGILDFFICIAVLHHLATPERRIEGIRVMADLLRVGGEGLIQVWAKDQKWSGQPAVYVEKNESSATQCCNHSQQSENAVVFRDSTLSVQKPRTPFVASDVLLPWNARKKGEDSTNSAVHNINRYYHVFEKGELENLISTIPCVKIVDCVYEQGNWSAIIRKIDSS